MQPITDQLVKMAVEGQHLSRRYVRMKLDAVKTREARAQPAFDHAKACLVRIAEYASAKKIRLGIEGRHGYEEIPSEREFPGLLDEINSPYVGYWHDFGHIQIKENLGFLDHVEWIKKIRSRLLGCHLHDVEWPGGDHRPPFTGSIAYEKIVPLLPKDCLFVWEMGPRRKAEHIIESLALWKERFGE